MAKEAQFQAEYAKALAMCSDTALRGLVKNLCLSDAQALEPVLRELGIGIPKIAKEMPLVRRTAHRCARVVDCASDPEWFPGSQDWLPLAEQIGDLAQKGVPAAPLVLIVLAARVANSWRENLSQAGSSATGTFSELGRVEERDFTRLTRNVANSVENLRSKISGASGDPGQSDGDGPFLALSLRLWWRHYGQELLELMRTLEQSSSGDRASFRLKLSQLEPFMPGDGQRDGHFPAIIYSAYEESLRLVREHWQKRGAVAATKQLFSSVGIELTDASIQQARRRKRIANK